MSQSDPPVTNSGRPSGLKLTILLGLVALIGFLTWQFRDSLQIEYFAAQEAKLQAWKETNAVLTYGVAFVVYAVVTGLSLPGASPLTLVYGWFFGLVGGVLLVSFASTTGATIAFLLSRYLLRDTIQNRFGDRLEAFQQNLERDGAFYLFTLRLIVAVPFWVINLVMGLTPIKTWTYWWVSQLGMLPATIVFVYAGSSVPDLQTLAEQGVRGILSPQLFVAFAVLGVFPIAVRAIMRRFR